MNTAQPEEEFDPTQTLTEIRRAARRIQARGATEALATELANGFTDLDDHIDAGGPMPDQWRNIVHGGRPRKHENGEVLDYVTHGTRSGYNRGCRCTRCRRANREHSARRNAQRREPT